MDITTVCLGLLTFGEASGYEIKKKLSEEPFSLYSDAGYGSIYPALKRLAQEGLVTLEEREQSGRPDKKIYRLTQLGRHELLRRLEQMPEPDRFRSDFLLLMQFAELLPASFLETVIDARLNFMRTRLAEFARFEAGDLPAGCRFVLGYGQAVYGAALEYLETHRHELVAQALLAEKAAE